MADGAEDDGAGSIRANWIGRLMVADVRSTGQEVRRTPRLIRGADNAYFQIAIVTDGSARIGQDDRQAELRPGDCAVYETTRPFQWRMTRADGWSRPAVTSWTRASTAVPCRRSRTGAVSATSAASTDPSNRPTGQAQGAA
jgi:AraC family transcriptional activator of tynA and feaB